MVLAACYHAFVETLVFDGSNTENDFPNRRRFETPSQTSSIFSSSTNVMSRRLGPSRHGRSAWLLGEKGHSHARMEARGFWWLGSLDFLPNDWLRHHQRRAPVDNGPPQDWIRRIAIPGACHNFAACACPRCCRICAVIAGANDARLKSDAADGSQQRSSGAASQ